MKKINKILCFLLALCTLCTSVFSLESVEIKQEYRFDSKSLCDFAGVAEKPQIKGENAYVLNLDTGAVVFEKDADKKAYPASCVKLMTALVVYENVKDLSEKVVVSKRAQREASGSNMALKEGEVLTVQELLLGVLVVGANDAAMALSDYICETEQEFCELMNKKAKELGANDTQFENVTGFHTSGTYTTARDMAIIAREVYYKSKLFEMTNTLRYTVEKTNKTDQIRTLINRNHLISRIRSQDYYYPRAHGMSLGSTPEGGHCVVSVGTDKNNLSYLCVVLGSEETDDVNYACKDIINIFDFCFENFSLKTAVSNTGAVCEIPVRLASDTDFVTLFPKEDVQMLLPEGLSYDEDITVEKRLFRQKVSAPVYKGDELGEIVVRYKDDAVIGRTKLVAGASVDRSNVLYFFSRIESFVSGTWFRVFAICTVVLLALYFWLCVYFERQRRYRGRRRRR